MNQLVEFGLFDPAHGAEVTRRNLPHWFQPNVTVFLTFRTADSLPRDVVKRWETEQRQWLNDEGWPLGVKDTLPRWNQLPDHLQEGFRNLRNGRWHWHLDSCHGECLLRRRELAEIGLNSLRHFDGDRYDLDSAVVMPNHVHALVQFRNGISCRKQSEGWLHYSARQINQRIGRTGAFWQSESFDHLVRSAEQFEYLRGYIERNGSKAKLPATDYLYWSRD